MPKVDRWMPFFIDKYLGDTMNFETTDHGAFCLVLFEMWKKSGYIKNDRRQLMTITKMTPKKFQKSYEKWRPLLRLNNDGFLYSEKLIKELQISKEKQLSYHKRGKKGASSRWDSDGSANGSANASAMLQLSKKNASAIHLKKVKGCKGEGLIFPEKDSEFMKGI